MPNVLIVRGGADFHDPVETTDSFVPFLRAAGFAVEVAEDLAVYEDEGRIFVSTVGHHLPDLDIPEVRTLTERGLLWAARRLDSEDMSV